MKYKNLSNSDHPATVIYLVNISNSMSTLSDNGNTRLDIARDAIQTTYAQMIQRSLRQGTIHPRYRIGMIAYSNDLHDIYAGMGSIITSDKLRDEGIPDLVPRQGANMAKAFRYATKIIQDDIKTWPLKWLNECPPPMVINITDYEFEADMEDLVKSANNLRMISVPDGNVLLQNIYITDQISPVSSDVKEWRGYHFNDSTGSVSGDKLLAISSPMPSSYRQIANEQMGIKIDDGVAMMFPGINREFIKTGFAMSIVSGSQVRYSSFPLQPVISKKERNKFSRSLKVFLCHSSDDKPYVRRLYHQLANEDWIDPWLDEKKIKPGQDWALEIQTAVEDSDVIVVCISNNSINKEGFVQKEIKMALDKADEKPEGAIFIIPLKLEDCLVPIRLRKWQWLDGFSDNSYSALLDAFEARAQKIIS